LAQKIGAIVGGNRDGDCESGCGRHAAGPAGR
jgi:hypothetical protein